MNIRFLTHFKSKEFTAQLLLFTMGFVVFSPVSSVITMDLIGLPLALPELLFIPLFLMLRRRLALKTFNNSILWLLPLFALLLLISLLLQNFRPGSILSTSRGYFYMMLAFAVFKGKNDTSIYDIMLVSLGSVSGWCFLTVSTFIKISYVHISGDSIAVYGNLLALSLLLAINIIYGNKKLIILSLLLGIILSLTTGLRRQILIFIITILLSYLFLFRFKIPRAIKTYLFFSLLIIVIFFSYGKIEDYVLERSPLLHYRVFTRTKQFLTGDYQASDQFRSNVIKTFTKNLPTYLFPRGFVSKRTSQDPDAGLYMDFPFIELSYMLGIFILAAFIISLFFYVYRHIKSYLYRRNNESAIWAVTGIIIFVLLFLEGTFLNYSFITPFTGMALGKLYTLNQNDLD